MVSLKSPGTTSYRSSIDIVAVNCLVFFRKSRFFHFGERLDKQTYRQTNSFGQHRCTKPLSLSRAAA